MNSVEFFLVNCSCLGMPSWWILHLWLRISFAQMGSYFQSADATCHGIACHSFKTWQEIPEILIWLQNAYRRKPIPGVIYAVNLQLTVKYWNLGGTRKVLTWYLEARQAPNAKMRSRSWQAGSYTALTSASVVSIGIYWSVITGPRGWASIIHWNIKQIRQVHRYKYLGLFHIRASLWRTCYGLPVRHNRGI